MSATSHPRFEWRSLVCTGTETHLAYIDVATMMSVATIKHGSNSMSYNVESHMLELPTNVWLTRHDAMEWIEAMVKFVDLGTRIDDLARQIGIGA